jgi:small subunit ribosomal protein S16
VGRKKQPYFRVVVVKRDAPRDGAYIEELGFYNPRTRPAFLTLDLEKLDQWIQDGAEISDSVKSLARKARKGGDDDVVFTKPGEEAPRLKTAKKPERRPKAAAPTEADDLSSETAEGEAEVTAAVETEEPAEETEPTEAQAEAETESEAAEASATEVEEAPEAEVEEAPDAEAEEDVEAEAEEAAESEAAEEVEAKAEDAEEAEAEDAAEDEAEEEEK